MVVGALLQALARRGCVRGEAAAGDRDDSTYPPEKGDYSFAYYFAASLQARGCRFRQAFRRVVGGRH